MADKLRWLYVPNAKPAKELSKHDQRMIRLGWDARKSFFKSQVEGLTVIGDEELTETAEMIFNFGIDIKGIKSLLWQHSKHQLQADKDKLLDGLEG